LIVDTTAVFFPAEPNALMAHIAKAAGGGAVQGLPTTVRANMEQTMNSFDAW
jgi:hypothetical protein